MMEKGSASDLKNSNRRRAPRSNSTFLPLDLRSVLQPTHFPSLPQGWSAYCQVEDKSGLDIFSTILLNESGAQKRVLFVIHGQGEHGGRYLHLPHYLRDAVSAIWCLDLRGHGRSAGTRGHVNRFSDYVDDALSVLMSLEEWNAGRGLELHLLGHSMGGLILLHLIRKHPDLKFSSAIFSSPCLALRVRVPLWKNLASRVLSEVWGSLQMTTPIDLKRLSHDPEVYECLKKDRLSHQKATPRYYMELLEAMSEIHAHPPELQVGQRALFLSGSDDVTVDPDAIRAFYERLHWKDKRHIEFPGLYHEVANEISKEVVLKEVEQWIIGKNSSG